MSHGNRQKPTSKESWQGGAPTAASEHVSIPQTPESHACVNHSSVRGGVCLKSGGDRWRGALRGVYHPPSFADGSAKRYAPSSPGGSPAEERCRQKPNKVPTVPGAALAWPSSHEENVEETKSRSAYLCLGTSEESFLIFFFFFLIFSRMYVCVFLLSVSVV